MGRWMAEEITRLNQIRLQRGANPPSRPRFQPRFGLACPTARDYCPALLNVGSPGLGGRLNDILGRVRSAARRPTYPVPTTRYFCP
jgi:hypothetical protein